MISLVDLGLRLDGLLFIAGLSTTGKPTLSEEADGSAIVVGVEELARALEIVQLLLGGELELMSEDEFAEFPTLEELEAQNEGS